MTSAQVTDRSGKTINVTEIDGRRYVRFPLESLKHVPVFKAKPDDILLCTFPKAGTHWFYEIIRFLLAGTTDLPIVEKQATMIEMVPPSVFDDLPSPRNMNTHYHFDAVSPEFIRQKSKIIYVSRDPRDTAVSFFLFHRYMKVYGYDGAWEDYLKLFMEGQGDYDSWFDYTRGWEKAMKDNPDNPFLVLSYEGMKEEPLKEIKRIADFLGTKHSEELLQEIVQKTSFDVMKSTRTADGTQYAGMYRKGQVGDWKNHFTVSQLEEFNEVFEKEMAGTDAYNLYSHNAKGKANGSDATDG